MKPLHTVFMLLLAACLQTCQENTLEPAGSQADLDATTEQTKWNGKNAFTLSAIVMDYGEPHNQFLIYIAGTRGSITVHWGDGTSTDYPFNGEEFEVSKEYASPGRYQIVITGDLKNIFHFQSSYGQGQFDEANFRVLTGLESVRLNNLPGPEVIDLSRTKNLSEFATLDIPAVEEIWLPKRHDLYAVALSGDTSLTASTVNNLINSVYQNAVQKQLWGFFHLERYPHDHDRDTIMVGPPSATSIAQLTELQNVYGWDIRPEMPRPAGE